MPRRWGDTHTRRAESNRTVPLHTIRPRSGVTSPATMLTIEVLPEPDGPNSAVTPSAASNVAATLKSPSFFSTSTASMSLPVEAGAGATREPFGDDQRGERDDDRDHDQACGRGIGVRNLRVGVDRGRDGLRLARDVRYERDGRAEFTERLGEAQHHAGDDAGQS